MPKKVKIFISLFLTLIFSLFFQVSSAKYVMEDTTIAVKLHIDRCEPNIELMDIVSSNVDYPKYANKTHTITGHIKITEKNIVKNDFSSDNINITVANHSVVPEFKSFSLVAENATEKIYEFSFTNIIGDGPLSLSIPAGIIEDRSGLTNKQKYFSTNLSIDNTPAIVTFAEHPSSQRKVNCRNYF